MGRRKAAVFPDPVWEQAMRYSLDFDNVLIRELCAVVTDRQLDFLVEELVLHASLLNVSNGVDDALGFKEARMGDGNAIGCAVTADPQCLQLLHTLSASRFMVITIAYAT
ncbi:hypothetical protein PRIPAC_82634 [Pristionchus pacificus]|uniref:Uncharacterized protein n=1 Tax=Pristionchus pacificus TaxID=54126 RepID=A0A2A6CNY5_PRIPA|nr:hypothetical protein PRIPAC_82634 [Pristionchus pacificus]|eukprot:PDM79912.1 hypothetical protein PRIPAC_32491 [Pristionchus pacificus]